MSGVPCGGERCPPGPAGLAAGSEHRPAQPGGRAVPGQSDAVGHPLQPPGKADMLSAVSKTSQLREVHSACQELTQDWLSGLAKVSG